MGKRESESTGVISSHAGTRWSVASQQLEQDSRDLQDLRGYSVRPLTASEFGSIFKDNSLTLVIPVMIR